MNRAHLTLITVVALAGTACAGAGLVVRPGEVPDDAFRVLVADFEANAGPGLAMTTDADGNPHLAYLGLEEEPKEGEPPSAPPGIGEPVPPLVKHAHYVGGAWARSVVAGEQDVDIDADQAAIAVDAQGVHHVAWSVGDAIRYASSGPEGFSEPVEVGDGAVPHSLSIAADANGSPLIVFVQATTGPEAGTDVVRLASLDGDRWSIETVAEASASDPPSTAIAAGDAGPVIAYTSEGATFLTERSGDIWESVSADENGGAGVSMAIDADGNPHLAYFSTRDGTVRHAHRVGGAWTTSEVSTEADFTSAASIALDSDGIHHVAWQVPAGLRYATNTDGEFAESDPPAGSEGGTLPKLAAGPEGVVYLAWYDPEGTEVLLGVKGGEEPLLAVPTNAPTGQPTEQPTDGPPACEPAGTELSIVAKGSTFSTDCLAAPAGEAFTIAFDNQDALPHNVAIYESQGGEPLFQPDLITGPAQETFEADPLEAGQFFFQCDAHATTMTGTFVVA